MKLKDVILILLLSVLATTQVFADPVKFDSLRALILKDQDDTLKVFHLNEYAYLFRNSYPDSTIIFSNQSIQLCEKIATTTSIKSWAGYGNAIGNLAIGYRLKGDYPKAKEFYFKALAMDQKMGYKFGIGKRLVGISNMYLNVGDLPNALKYSFKALEANTEIKNERAIALSLGIIGNVNAELGNFDIALINEFKSLKTFEKINDYNNTQATYTQIGRIYKELKQYAKSITYLNKALVVANENDLMQQKAETLNELGSVYLALNEYQKSINYIKEALNISLKNKIKSEIAIAYFNYGCNLLYLDSLEKSEQLLNNALAISIESAALSKQVLIYEKLYELYEKKQLISKSFTYFKLFINLKDSVYNKINAQKIMIIEFEKLKSEENLKQKENQIIALQEIEKQKTFRNYFLGGFALMLIIAGFSFRSYRLKQKDNVIINKQKLIVENQNHEITDSIQYAQRIQQAILPTKETIAKAFPQSFVLFKPKDIVSGDFYWFQQIDDKQFIAACDCTGHGVPGALMSMVATDMLNESLVHTKDVGLILSQTNKSIKTALKQTNEDDSTRDGMDLALCCFSNLESENAIVTYAGAYRPLWLIKKDAKEITEYKATKAAIGGLTDENQVFESHTIPLQKGDTIYLSSDGYADQFSPADKKLMTKKFKEILLSIQHLNMREQQSYLDQFITDWKGNMEQTDDILVIGVRV